jgi:hypothetical protein
LTPETLSQAEFASEEDRAASKAQTTYVQRLTAKILDNLEIHVENVHLRYEDESTISGLFSRIHSVWDACAVFVGIIATAPGYLLTPIHYHSTRILIHLSQM